MLDHPGNSAIQAALPAEPWAAAGIVSAVRVAVVSDAAQLVTGENAAEGRCTVPAYLPDTERSRDRRHRERMRRDRAAQNFCRHLTRTLNSHPRKICRATDMLEAPWAALWLAVHDFQRTKGKRDHFVRVRALPCLVRLGVMVETGSPVIDLTEFWDQGVCVQQDIRSR